MANNRAWRSTVQINVAVCRRCYRVRSLGRCISCPRISTLNAFALATTAPTTVNVYAGLYRMVGALYTTTGSTPPLVSFVQDNDTFYLATPAADINNTIGTSAGNIALASVPNGISVEAMGRCVGTRAQTHKIQHTIAATRQTDARKFLASLS
jgi:hypothetical protein